jgi:TfoX/Sxy family transcriptional regulator of competence genes
LADRVRELVAGVPDVFEQRMFGGLVFLVNGNMSVAVSGQGDLLVRVDPVDGDVLIDNEHVKPMVMRRREMSRWLRVDTLAVNTDGQLEQWVARGVGHARSLSTKKANQRSRTIR